MKITMCSMPMCPHRSDMYSLADHQKRILARMNERGSLGIFAEAGTGKTMIALTWIYDNLMAGRIDNALVICPASLIGSWRSAIEKMRYFGYSDFEIQVVTDAVTLISYNSVWIRNKQFKRRKGTHKYEIRPTIDHPWGVIFCDESHRLGDPSSVQTKVILRIIPLSEHRFVMSGTPDNMRYVKLYGQLKFVNPDLFVDYKDFDRKYVLAKDFFDNPIRYDVPALESLKREYGSVARLRECFDMPESTETDIPLDMDPKTREAYRSMILKTNPDVDFNTAGVSSMKALQVCTGFYYTRDKEVVRLKASKIDAMMDILESAEKTVVFCLFIPSIDLICETLAKEKIRYLRFDSSVSEFVWRDFQSDPDIKVFVTQYQKGSEGIDLFSANTMIFFEPTPSAYNLEQAKARIMRKGQMNHCSYYYLYSPDTVEEKRMRSVRNGVDESREMADEWAEEERQRFLSEQGL